MEVHHTRDTVQSLTVASAVACFVPQGAGVKVLSWSSSSVQCMPINGDDDGDVLVVGTSDGRIQVRCTRTWINSSGSCSTE
jgi:hypothetical protein